MNAEILYTEPFIITELTSNGKNISDYLVIKGHGQIDDILFFIHENVLFYHLIEDRKLAKACIEYIKKQGAVFDSKENLKLKRPELIFG